MDAPSDAGPAATTRGGPLHESERRLVLLLAVVQFVNVLDFMMVMPLGPDFSRALGIPIAKLGLIGGSYTAAASVSGFVSTFVIDRFRRKQALMVVVAGLGLATLAGALATGLGTLLLARVLAGAFGGPATALSLAIVADAVPLERRGRALGMVMGAFSIASIAGVPAGLELARLGGWRAPFVAVGLLTLVTVAGAQLVMKDTGAPPRREGLSASRLFAQLRETDSALSFLIGALVMFASFLVVPNIASYVQKNLGYPRERIGLMYLTGGVTSLVAMQIAGRAIDRYGARTTNLVGSLVAITALVVGIVSPIASLPPPVFSALFMAGTSVRAIAFNALTSRVPAPEERGAFMSMQSTLQHLASAAGAFVSSQLLQSDATGYLIGIDRVALVSVALSVLVPLLVALLERRVDARQLAVVEGATGAP
ncbi:MAG: MFS transporter [Deltaproteobacteria bacterium]|nr:MFS transporter [Deltaproteobacteria bacterium]